MTSTRPPSLFSVRAALAYSRNRTPRKPNWSEVECDYLLQEIQKNISIIRSRKPNLQGSRKCTKTEMWNRMCVELHAKRPTVTRSVSEVKDKWKKLQFMASQHLTKVLKDPTSHRNPQGLLVIPKLVFRVLEARGQDPRKGGFCCNTNSNEMSGRPRHDFDNIRVSSEQERAVQLNSDLQVDATSAVKEEVNEHQVLSHQSPDETDLTLKIQSTVSLAPGQEQSRQNTEHGPTTSMQTHPVALNKARPASLSEIRPTSFPISSQFLQHKKSKRGATQSGYSHWQQQQQQMACSNQTHSEVGLGHNHPLSQQIQQEITAEDSTSFDNSLNCSYSLPDELHTSVQLSDTDHMLLNECNDVIFESVEKPSKQSAHTCARNLLGHVCDEEVITLQKEVLREERDKIRLEKEILEIQRDKLKLEFMVLRQKVNGVRCTQQTAD